MEIKFNKPLSFSPVILIQVSGEINLAWLYYYQQETK